MTYEQCTIDLFGWGHDGQLPAEVHAYLAEPGVLEALADDLIRKDIEQTKEAGHPPGKRRPAESQGEMAAVAFVLTQYCHEVGRPPPVALLDLLARALGLVINPVSGDTIPRPPLELFGYPSGVNRNNIDLFLRAAQLEGEAIAEDTSWDNKALARHLSTDDEGLANPRSVDPKTVRNWRASDAWHRRVKFVSEHARIEADTYARLKKTPVRRP